jgi:hypothetical protein
MRAYLSILTEPFHNYSVIIIDEFALCTII